MLCDSVSSQMSDVAFSLKLSFKLFQLNRAKWIHFTKRNSRTETAVGVNLLKALVVCNSLHLV